MHCALVLAAGVCPRLPPGVSPIPPSVVLQYVLSGAQVAVVHEQCASFSNSSAASDSLELVVLRKIYVGVVVIVVAGAERSNLV